LPTLRLLFLKSLHGRWNSEAEKQALGNLMILQYLLKQALTDMKKFIMLPPAAALLMSARGKNSGVRR